MRLEAETCCLMRPLHMPALLPFCSLEQSSRASSLGSDSRPVVLQTGKPRKQEVPSKETPETSGHNPGKRKASDDAEEAGTAGGEPKRHQKRKIEYAAVLQPSGACPEQCLLPCGGDTLSQFPHEPTDLNGAFPWIDMFNIKQ